MHRSGLINGTGVNPLLRTCTQDRASPPSYSRPRSTPFSVSRGQKRNYSESSQNENSRGRWAETLENGAFVPGQIQATV